MHQSRNWQEGDQDQSQPTEIYGNLSFQIMAAAVSAVRLAAATTSASGQ